MTVNPAQIHAKQHAGPILGFRTARPRLYIDEAIAGVHLAREHATELQIRHGLFQTVEFGTDIRQCPLVTFFSSQIQQILGIHQAAVEAIQCQHHAFEVHALLADSLCLFGIIPERRVFKLTHHLFEAFFFQVIVKDTP